MKHYNIIEKATNTVVCRVYATSVHFNDPDKRIATFYFGKMPMNKVDTRKCYFCEVLS